MRNMHRRGRGRSSNQPGSNRDRDYRGRFTREENSGGDYSSREWYDDDDSHYDRGNYSHGGYGSYGDMGSAGGNNTYERGGNSWRNSGRGYGNDPESYASSYGRDEYGNFPESGYRRGISADDTSSYGDRSNYGYNEDYGNSRGQNSGNWGFGRAWNQDDESSTSTRGTAGNRGQSGLSNWGNRFSENFRGKGPKGYQRSDERIQEDVNDRLSDDDQLDASEIEVKVENGEVTLSGSVSERDAKRRAEDLVESVSGVKNVENRIRIGDKSPSKDESSRSGNSTKSNDRSKIRESIA
ncbi:MAG TPA: BON domain-containing protein [Cyclobacteriaceae bacterium]